MDGVKSASFVFGLPCLAPISGKKTRAGVRTRSKCGEREQERIRKSTRGDKIRRMGVGVGETEEEEEDEEGRGEN